MTAISNLQFQKGDLLDAKEDYIVQQNCCIACRPHGLSQTIADRYPYANPYQLLIPMKKGGNTATEETRYIPGTCEIFGSGEERKVACLFGQYAMGKPGKYNSFGIPDTAEDRIRYFEEALEDLVRQIPHTSSVAFPYKIGCGLAGGNWVKYSMILQKFAKKNPSMKIVVYSL